MKEEGQKQTILNESTPLLSSSVKDHPVVSSLTAANKGEDEEEPTTEEVSSSSSSLSSCCSSGASACTTCLKCVHRFYSENAFMIHIIVSIGFAKLYPPLGATYVRPQITSSWLAVMFIFTMAGLSLETSELKHASLRIWFNVYVEGFNFGIISLLAFGCTRLLFLVWKTLLPEGITNAIIICGCMPISINSLLVLTKSSNGEEASAVFHAAAGSFLGVFISPLLVLGYIGLSAEVDLTSVLFKLAFRVLAPVFCGQVLRNTVPQVVRFVQAYRKYFKKTQEFCLIFMVYTTFCHTFQEQVDASFIDFIIMVVIQMVLLCSSMILSWYSLKVMYRNEPKLRVAGLFACTLKSVAIGIPLINAIYEHDPKIGLYSLPLLVWQQSQLLVGSWLSPRLAKFVDEQQQQQQQQQALLG